ncbi:hypothetical protein FJZ53_00370 [Candidatus Woesearchaeota archaeon]|nr:hypothetical protein [Candidatus Woesearchaeota archaeon]
MKTDTGWEVEKGNIAGAKAAILAGAWTEDMAKKAGIAKPLRLGYSGYPITPSSEYIEYVAEVYSKNVKEAVEKGKPMHEYVYELPLEQRVEFFQSMSEVDAINDVVGYAMGGARSMSATAGLGIDLMSEGISYATCMDIPFVLIDCMRGGPGLANIQPTQADYRQITSGIGHGDMRLLVLAPNSVQEIAELMFDIFNLTDKYRMPGILAYDGLLGQLKENFKFPEPKIEIYNKSWALTGPGNRIPIPIDQRYKNLDPELADILVKNDEIFVKKGWIKKDGTGSMILNSLLEGDNDMFERHKELRGERWAYVEKNEVKYEQYKLDDAEIVVAAFGTPSRIAEEAIDQARAKGIKVGMLRPITLWPFPKKKIKELSEKAKVFLSVEMNQGQMIETIDAAARGKIPTTFFSRDGGNVMAPDEILSQIVKLNDPEFYKKISEEYQRTGEFVRLKK